MKCRKFGKWISDGIDGRLSTEHQAILEAHLRECTACRSCRERLEKIQKDSKAHSHPELSPGYWRDSLLRLRKALEAREQAKPKAWPGKVLSFFTKRRWAWAGAAGLFIAALGLIFFFSRTPSSQEMFAFSFRDTLNGIDLEIGNNPELEKEFNSAIQNSIYDHLGEMKGMINPFHYENPLFLESLDEEDLQILDAALRKELKL